MAWFELPKEGETFGFPFLNLFLFWKGGESSRSGFDSGKPRLGFVTFRSRGKLAEIPAAAPYFLRSKFNKKFIFLQRKTYIHR